MAYIGRSVDIGMFEKQVLTPDSSTTTFTLTFAVGAANSLLVVYGGVIQEPNVAYSVSGGGQSIVFSEAPVSGTTLYIIYLGKQLLTPRTAGQETTKQTFTGNGTQTLFTLTDPPVVPSGIMVFVDGILQREGAGGNYVSSGSTINFDGAPDNGSEIDVYTLVKEKVSIDTVADGSITRAKLAQSAPYWDAQGNFGIGVQPTNALDVYRASSTATFSLNSASTNNADLADLRVVGNDVTGRLSAYGTTHGSRSNQVWVNANTNTPLILSTNNTERARVSAAGNVGINQTNPAELLHVTGGRIQVGYGSNQDLVIGQSPASLPSNDLRAYISWGADTVYPGGAINGDIVMVPRTTANGQVRIYTGSGTPSERFRVNNFGVGLGGSFASDGMGITFPATQVASSNPNTLDDYEEGTWFPTWQGEGSNPTVTYAEQLGRYVKIGSLVLYSIRLVTASKSGGSGRLFINLPFTSANFTTGIGGGSMTPNFVYQFSSPIPDNGYTLSGQNRLVFIDRVTNADITTASLGGSSYFNISGFFYTAT